MSRSVQKLSAVVSKRIVAFPSTGEINRKVPDAKAAIDKVRAAYESHAVSVDETDGVSMDFGVWRFNLRSSNTEPVIRLNVESRADLALMQQHTDAILVLL